MTKGKNNRRRRKVTAFLLALCMVWLMLPPGEARAATPQPEAEVQQTYVDDSTDINAIPAYQPEGDSKILSYVHSEVFAKGDHIARLKQDETLSSYAFLNRDGTKTVYYLDEAVKFTAADGSIREKDLTLTAAMKGYQTAENDIGLHISENPAAGIRIAYNNKQITLLPNGGSGAGQLSGNTVRYEGYYGEDTALVYTPTLNGVKEEIILSSYTGQNEFVFYINTGGLTMYPLGDRYYLAESKTDTNRIWLGQIEVFDSNLKPCKGSMTAVTVLQGQRYKLTVTVDEDYLTASDTCYPVTVDPTLTVSDAQTGANAIQDAPVYEGYSTSNFGSYQYNRAGYAGTAYKKGRTAVKLSGLLSDSGYMNAVAGEITSAQFYMADASGTSNAYVKVYALSSNSTWTENTVTWNNAGTTASTPYANIAPPAGGFGCFDITGLVKAWKNGYYSSGQCGFILKGSDETSVDKVLYSCEHSTSAMRPYVTVTYSTGSRTVNITNTAISVNEESTKTLTATTSPTGQTVYWESDNEAVATVSSSGVVTGINSGTATITACLASGESDICTVYVVKAAGVYRMRNVASDYYLDGGGANIAPDNLTNVRQKSLINAGADRLAQMWKINYLGSGMYSIRPMHKLDMGLHGTASDVFLQQIGTTDTYAGVAESARWSISYKSNGYELKSDSEPYRALSPHQGATAENTTVVTVSYTGSTAQRWRLIAVEPPPATILFYHTISGEVLTNPEFHIAEGQTKGFDNWFVIPAVVSGDTNYQNVILVQPETGGVTVNSGQVIAGIQSGEAERYVNITVWGASDADAQGTFTLKVLDESRAIYYDHYYVDGLIEDELLAKISTAVSFADHVYYKEFGISLASSGAPQIHSAITNLINQCSQNDNEGEKYCTTDACGSQCSNHHKNTARIRELLLESREEYNHFPILWTNVESPFFCISDPIGGTHTPVGVLGITEPEANVLQIARVDGNTDLQKEACMGIVLAHEMAHCIGLDEQYGTSDNPTEHDTRTDRCAMDSYHKRANTDNRQFYEDILTEQNNATAFCSECKNALEDMVESKFELW